MDRQSCLSAPFCNEENFVTSSLLPWTTKPFKNAIDTEWKDLAPGGGGLNGKNLLLGEGGLNGKNLLLREGGLNGENLLLGEGGGT